MRTRKFDRYFKREMCQKTNLLCFVQREDIARYRDETQGREHQFPMLKVWMCEACQRYHYWSSCSYTDSNGKFRSGSGEMSDYVRRLWQLPEWRGQVGIAREELVTTS